MRKIWLLLVIGLSWWLGPTSGVAAESTYDPVQGGVFWEPPAEMWLPPAETGFIPFGYAPGGRFDAEGIEITPTVVNLPGSIGKGYVHPHDSRLGLTAMFSNRGNYQVTMLLKDSSSTVSLERTVIFHVSDQPEPVTLLPLPAQRLLTPIPILLETVSPQEARFLSVMQVQVTDKLKFLQPSKPTLYYVPVPGVKRADGAEITDATVTFKYNLSVGADIPGSVTFGLAPIVAKWGQPIKLDAAYLAPRPGTTLTFEWVYQATGSNVRDSRLTHDPWLAIPETWHDPGKLQVRLHYDYEGKRVSVYSNEADYHYQPESPAQTVMTANVADLLAHDVTLGSDWSDWQIDQPGAWQLEVAVDPLRSPEGAQLAANLILPGGRTVAAGQARRLAYNGAYNLALTQAKWLLQQQPDVLRGQYQTRVRFTVISGPE